MKLSDPVLQIYALLKVGGVMFYILHNHLMSIFDIFEYFILSIQYDSLLLVWDTGIA